MGFLYRLAKVVLAGLKLKANDPYTVILGVQDVHLDFLKVFCIFLHPQFMPHLLSFQKISDDFRK